MKPSRIAILIAVILLVVGGTTAFAASSSAVQPQPNTNCAFRDADGDGICDVCGAAQTAATCSRRRRNLRQLSRRPDDHFFQGPGQCLAPHSARRARPSDRPPLGRAPRLLSHHQKREDTMRSEQEVNAAIDRYADTVRRLCMLHLKNYADTEDIFQTVFLKYALHTAPFADGEHEKAWLIRVTLNACKDLLKSVFRSRTVALEAAANLPAPVPQEHQEVLEAVLALPKKYKDVVYLHYYEGYSAPEIAGLLHRNVNTIYTWLGRAKALLRTALEEGGGEDG